MNGCDLSEVHEVLWGVPEKDQKMVEEDVSLALWGNSDKCLHSLPPHQTSRTCRRGLLDFKDTLFKQLIQTAATLRAIPAEISPIFHTDEPDVLARVSNKQHLDMWVTDDRQCAYCLPKKVAREPSLSARGVRISHIFTPRIAFWLSTHHTESRIRMPCTYCK